MSRNAFSLHDAAWAHRQSRLEEIRDTMKDKTNEPFAPQRRLPEIRLLGVTFESDCIVNGVEIKAGTTIPCAPPSETTPIPQSKTQQKRFAAQMEPRGCPTPGACSCPIPDVDAGTQLVRLTAELADLKQRLLPQFQGRAERAESHLAAAETQLQEAWRQVAQTMDAPQSATAAPLVEEKAVGHARYAYLRTLNPRKFSALYNEALMGVHQFDDLVDRYRDAGEKP